jgi:hypothetical protein
MLMELVQGFGSSSVVEPYSYMVRYNEVKTGNQKSVFKAAFRTISLYDIMFLSLCHDVSWLPFHSI